MIDETFGEIEYSEDYGYIGRKNIPFGGNENSVEITVMCDDEEELPEEVLEALEAL